MTAVDSSTALILLDGPAAGFGPGRVTALWSRSAAPPAEGVSIPELVEEQGLEIRRDYLNWVHALGLADVRGGSLRSALRLRPGGVSFWWMTLVAEKEPLKSSAIYQIFKLRALEKVYRERECSGLVYCGADRRLHHVLRDWCRAMGHPYAWRRAGAPPRSVSRLPHPLQALIFLGWRWWQRYRRVWSRPAGLPPAAGATVVSYFPNVDLAQTRTGRFWSNYWQELHRLLDELPAAVNWVWLYANSAQCTFAEALALRDVCNAARPEKYHHYLLEDFLTPRGLLRGLFDYLRLSSRAFGLGGLRGQFHFPGSAIDFFPLLQPDWESSLFGRVAMENCLLAAAFEAMADALPARPWGLYLWEGQPWELALLAAWRQHPPERTIGFQHSAFGRLELRSFVAEQGYADDAPDAYPLPEVLAVNGAGPQALLREAGLPAKHMVQAEALRYLSLTRAGPPAVRSKAPILLVVGGYLPSEVRFQMDLLAQAARLGALERFVTVWIKPHPMCPLEPLLSAPPAFRYEVIETPLPALWAQAERAVTANSTAAAIEGLYLGLPVAVCLAGDAMNMSPLWQEAGVPMIGDAPALVRFLQSGVAAEIPTNYFLLDRDLPSWRRLLAV